MKRIALVVIAALCSLALSAQEDAIKVNYQGDKPTIKDFVWSFVSTPIEDEEYGESSYYDNSVREAWIRQRDGLPQPEGVTLTIDQKNGFVVYEFKEESYLVRKEMCYWNEADGKHKLFAFSDWAFNSKGMPILTETCGMMFFRYDNATKKMTYCKAPGFEISYDASYSLPRTGKDITVTHYLENGTRQQETLKWDGHGFMSYLAGRTDIGKNWFQGDWTSEVEEDERGFGASLLKEYNLITLEEDTKFYFLDIDVDGFAPLTDQDITTVLCIRKGAKYIDGGYEFDSYIPDPRNADAMLRFGISTLNGKEVFTIADTYHRK